MLLAVVFRYVVYAYNENEITPYPFTGSCVEKA